MPHNKQVERPEPSARRELENSGAQLEARRRWRSARTPGWAASWNFDLGVTARRSGINGCRNASQCALDARPSRFAEYDDGDSAIREVLLVTALRVSGKEQIEASGLRNREQFPIA
jgi:hypothetical protein